MSNTVNIIDYKLHSNKLAKVIISYTGDIDSAWMKAELSKKMGYLATPVQSSFKAIKAGVAVGFVRANREVRTITKMEASKYRVMSSNILMDSADKTLWDVKEGAGGKYLARHGEEDLASLIESSVYRRSDLPALRHVTIAKAAPNELVAWVDNEGDMDYGFAVATNDEKVKVVSWNRRIPINVDYDAVVSIQPVPVPAAIKNEVVASLTAEQKKNAIDYWTRLYGYAPDYLREVIEQVQEGTEL